MNCVRHSRRDNRSPWVALDQLRLAIHKLPREAVGVANLRIGALARTIAGAATRR